MAPRTSWKGYLKLSLVSVPVKAVTANNTSEEIRLNQLHKDCHARVKYKKVCLEHGELEQKDIVSGYEYAKDQYVVIDPAELNKLRTESDKTVKIDGFIDPEKIDPLYHAGKTYYLLPDGIPGNKPYALLHQGMVEAGVHAIAQIVLSGREQLVLLRPKENLLVMSVLSYPKKVKALDDFVGEVADQEATPEEMALAHTLIGASKIEEFDLSSYKDEYVEKLGELIQLRVDGKEVVQAPDREEPVILNLMDALKKSVAEAQLADDKKQAPSTKHARERSTKKASGKLAPSTKSTKKKAKKNTRRKTG